MTTASLSLSLSSIMTYLIPNEEDNKERHFCVFFKQCHSPVFVQICLAALLKSESCSNTNTHLKTLSSATLGTGQRQQQTLVSKLKPNSKCQLNFSSACQHLNTVTLYDCSGCVSARTWLSTWTCLYDHVRHRCSSLSICLDTNKNAQIASERR